MRIAPAARRGALLLSALVPLVAHADEHETVQPGDERTDVPTWWAALGLEGGAFLHGLDGRLMSSDIANPPIPSPPAVANPQPIRPFAADSGNFVVPYIEGSLELVGPAWIFDARPFVSAGFGGEFSVSRDIAKEGTTGEFELPPLCCGSTTDTGEQEALVKGQGSRLTAQFSSLYLTAGAGVAIPFETDAHAFRVKPSFRYMRDEVEVDGVVQRALLKEAGAHPNAVPDDFATISLNASDTFAFNSIGPAVEIDTDLSRKGRMVASVFVAGAVYFLIGDRDFAFRATNPDGESADFRVERDSVSYRLGIGVRLRFEP